MAKTHLAIGGRSVACGAESNWRTRGMLYTNLVLSKSPGPVTCGACKRTLVFERTCDAENQRHG